MDITIATAVARSLIDDHRSAGSLGRTPGRRGSSVAPSSRSVVAAPAAWAAILLFSVMILQASIPTLSQAPASDVAPGPSPAPAPAPLAAVDFPEHARVGAACSAILTRSSASDNSRSDRALEITTRLLADACLGA